MIRRYQDGAQDPIGWRETVVWHLEQAGALNQAAMLALDVVEVRITRLVFGGARSWAEQALTLIGRLPAEDQIGYELRACTLTLAVLEFGGQYREGQDYARRLLRAAQHQHNVEAETRALMALGRMQRELGQLAVAEQTLLRARELSERDELGDLEAEVRLHLAKVHQLQGRHLEALQELQLAREEHEQSDDRVRLARVFTGIGDIYRVLSSTQQALSFYLRALSLEQGLGNLLGQAMLKDKLALVALDQVHLGEALASAEEACMLRERLHDVVGEARSRTVIGTILGRMGRSEAALVSLRRACELQEQIQNPRGQGIALLHLGDVARQMRRFDTAHNSYTAALVLARRDGDHVGVARGLERLGDLSFDEGRRDQANIHWAEALRIREGLHHSDEAGLLRSRIQSGPPRRN
jgi:tetratricopeptide (TPR) repeat protein